MVDECLWGTARHSERVGLENMSGKPVLSVQLVDFPMDWWATLLEITAYNFNDGIHPG